jgi:hypothetical protein
MHELKFEESWVRWEEQLGNFIARLIVQEKYI